jgi:hypothetical protein
MWIGARVTVIRNVFEIGGVVISLLLIVVGGGLTTDPVVLTMTATGISLSLMVAAFVGRWRKPARQRATV